MLAWEGGDCMRRKMTKEKDEKGKAEGVRGRRREGMDGGSKDLGLEAGDGDGERGCRKRGGRGIGEEGAGKGAS